jgi:hypothetical protein
MPEPGWQKFERRIASLFGGIRRGAQTSRNGHGKSDVIAPGWSIETKLLARPCFQDMVNACCQAEKNRDDEMDIPVAIVKKKGQYDKDALVVMRLETFSEFFINQPEEQ